MKKPEQISSLSNSIDESLDVLIIGGGIAGLWLLNSLSNKGYNVALLEQDSLGGGQTIASQGMIHGGLKYALAGKLTRSSEAIAEMPAVWRRCLKGEGNVDLRAAKVLSDHFYLWSSNSVASRVSSFFASKATRGRVNKVKPENYPKAFRSQDFKGSVYQMIDLVLDVPSVLSSLYRNCESQIFKFDWSNASFERKNNSIIALNIQHGQQNLRLRAKQWVFTAGEGNAELLRHLGCKKPEMQRRPLHQVMVKHQNDTPLYAHCIGTSTSPRLTISSHPCEDGSLIWYLGGDIATEGITKTPAKLIETAKQELAELFPWLGFSTAQWSTLRIDRAEPKQTKLIKPDRAFAEIAQGCTNLIVAWPTKLSLAPDLAEQVLRLLDAGNILPTEKPEKLQYLSLLQKPCVSTMPWETAFGGAANSGSKT